MPLSFRSGWTGRRFCLSSRLMAATRTIGNRLAPPRFILFFVVLIAGVILARAMLPPAHATMIAFDAAAGLFLLLCVPLLRREAEAMRKSARENDANRVILLLLTVVLTLVILVTVAGELAGGGHPSPTEKLLVAVTLMLAWTFANTVYAFHYAHLYYTSRDDGGDLGGLDFPGRRPEPDYADFLYFSFTLGIALQTSDVAIHSPRIRTIVIGHCVAAFIYNLGVLALAINILASR
jgi:uncharacterized membrane protein